METKRKKNKILMIIGAILVLGSASFFIYLNYIDFKDKKTTNQIIENIFPDNNYNTVDNTKTENKQDTTLTDNYLGYIELPKYNIKRLITSSTDKKTLDKGLVGTLSVSAGLDDTNGNIILAGHNNKNIFQKLHSSKINDEIKITTHKDTYVFKITEKHIINDTDFSYFEKLENEKRLTLITCTNDSHKRLIVIAKGE